MSMALLRNIRPITNLFKNTITNTRIIKSRHFFTLRALNNKTYTETDEWLLKLDDFTHKVGISNHASEQLGDLVYIEYCLEPGEDFNEGDDIVIIESVKASNSVKAPFDGKLVENNSLIEENPDKVSEMPEDDNVAWFCKIDIKKEDTWI